MQGCGHPLRSIYLTVSWVANGDLRTPKLSPKSADFVRSAVLFNMYQRELSRIYFRTVLTIDRIECDLDGHRRVAHDISEKEGSTWLKLKQAL